MDIDQIQLIRETINQAIQENVNGKIDKMNVKLDSYIKEDNAWKDSITPSIDIMKQLQGTVTTLTVVVKAIIAIGTATTIVWGIISYIKKLK